MKKRELSLVVPLNGKVVPLKEVPDPVFSQEMMGKGCAIIPSDGNIYSPVNGVVRMIAPTKHAIGLESENGLEILIHFGLETVALKGEGFEVLVGEGQEVKQGDLLIQANYMFMKENNINMITPVVITRSLDDIDLNFNYGELRAKDNLLSNILDKAKEVVEEMVDRSEERRVGKECRSRWSPYH